MSFIMGLHFKFNKTKEFFFLITINYEIIKTNILLNNTLRHDLNTIRVFIDSEQ